MTQGEMKELRDYFDGKFEGVDRRLDGIDKRFDGVDKRFDSIDVTLEQEFGAITTHFIELRGYIDDAYQRTNDRIDVQVEALRGDLKKK